MYSPFFLFLTVYTVWVYSKGCVGVQGDFLSKNVYVFMVFDKKSPSTPTHAFEYTQTQKKVKNKKNGEYMHARV